jgi:phosphate transport system permease protein
MERRTVEERFFKLLMIISMLFVTGSFFWVVGTVVVKGLPALNWDMVSKIPTGGFYIGKEGGVLNAIVGSLYIAVGASVLGLLISLPIVLFINVYLRKKSILGTVTRLAHDVLFGIPSIVYGAFGFAIMIAFGLRASLLGGILAVTFLVIPIMIRTIDEVLKTVPREIQEATLSLGATRFEVTKVIIKQITPGILTALLLSFGRAIGDAASVLFTAGFSDNIPVALGEPAATLPLAIFFQLGSPIEEVQARAYASALILTIIVLAISITARILSKRFSKNKI